MNIFTIDTFNYTHCYFSNEQGYTARLNKNTQILDVFSPEEKCLGTYRGVRNVEHALEMLNDEIR